MFLKPNTSVIGPGEPIFYPKQTEELHYEGELAVVIGRTMKGVGVDEALRYVAGYTIANDVSARDHQRHDGQWTRAKGHDTFCPLGPWIETSLDASDVDIKTEVNGQVKQDSSTAFLLHDIPKIIEWISAVMTLLPGDVILTGTPAGVGPLEDGDTVSVGRVELRAIHLVGHTPGSIALRYADPEGHDHLFTGDALFPGGVGATFGDADAFRQLVGRDEHADQHRQRHEHLDQCEAL